MATEKKNEKKHELKDIQLFEENGQYYLKLKYILEDEYRIKELEIPKVKITVNKYTYPHINFIRQTIGDPIYDLYAGYGDCLPMLPGETSEANHVYFTEKIIEEKHKEMTIAEIEKKLGYKIKIVSEE